MVSKENAKELLESLIERTNDVQGALIATADGIAVTNVNINDKSNRLAAMSASTLGLGKQVISTVINGQLNEVTISGENAQVFIYSLSSSSVLVVVTKGTPNVAMVNWEARKTIAELTAVQ